MKDLTLKIHELLTNEVEHSRIKEIFAARPGEISEEISMKDAFKKYEGLRAFILDSIEEGYFDEIPYPRRRAIHSSINSIVSLNSRYGNVVGNIEELQDHLNQTGLFYRDIRKIDFTKELTDLAKLKRSLTNFINKFDENKKELDYISKKKNEVDDLVVRIKNEETNLINSKKSIEAEYDLVAEQKETIDSISDEINESKKEVEETKLSISTFSKNIDEYKKSIVDLENRAKEIISKEQKINKLIEEAEKALNLKSAEGISAAFSSQYATASDIKQRRFWLILAGAFVLVAILLTIWIVGGWWIKNPDAISSILGRIFGVGIAVAGAAFCARQYVKQKEIAEDYAYKVVLSKSILAFAEEIDLAHDDNGENVSKYLQKVLDEIHKDPLRSRRESRRRSKLPDETLETLKTLIAAIKQN